MSDDKKVVPVDDSVEKLKEKYGKIYQLNFTLTPDDDTTVELIYIFKKPTAASYDRYIKDASNGMSRASKTFLYDNVIIEHKDRLGNDLENYPALALSVCEKLLTMLGFSKISNLTML